ncbi:MAG: hypothetical protein PHP64_07915, partial [Actinomycetota bacterium]|nr:hypothetical protein [Actinomycetota bacterium]
STRFEIGEIEKKGTDFLNKTNFGDLKSLLDAYQQYDSLLEKRGRVSAAAVALCGGKSFEELEQEKKDVSLLVASLDAQVEEIEPQKLEPLDFENLSRRRDELERRLTDSIRKRDEIKYHLENLPGYEDESIEFEERLSSLWEKEKEAEKTLEVYELALYGMERAKKELLSGAVPILEKGVAQTFSSLTGGRYEEIQVSEEDLSISVFSKEKDDFIPAPEVVSLLSKGTLSQLYLSARLKLAELISGGKNPPLIFDDSFSYFDDERIERLWAIIEEKAQEEQVILLTCTSRYDRFLSPEVNLIELGLR